MPTLYTLAEKNVLKSWVYIGFFLIFIILIGWAISWALDSSAILIFAVVFSVVTSFFSYWYSDSIVLSLTRAKEIKKEDNPELYRLVENLCITAGLPLPKIYILEESQLNAFATGRDPKHGAIAVTRGLLERLDRVELEGVIAHELSHIGNRDSLLSTIAVVLVGIVVLVTDFALRTSLWGNRGSRRDDRGNNAIALVIVLVLAILAPIMANLLKLAISRKREFLADASGALLTRYPEGLALALEKISKDSTPLRVANNATSHLFLASPFRGQEQKMWFYKLFLTHPPIEERVSALRQLKI